MMKTQSFKNVWQDIKAHQETLNAFSLKKLFLENDNRFADLSLEVGDILFDFSKQHITKATIEKLCQLAEACQLFERRAALFSGEKLNYTENRAVLHTVLRDASADALWYEEENIKQKVQQVLQKMQHFSESIHSGRKKGVTGQCFTDVLCLGIGGSELGPALVCEALQAQKPDHTNTNNINTTLLKPHFISNIDGHTLERVLKDLNPETTLCIISSKTFTTPETLANATAVKAWYNNYLGSKVGSSGSKGGSAGSKEGSNATMAHFLAVTANVERAHAFGIQKEQIFEFWEWVGGRYSIWSAVGLPIILAYGFSVFQNFLAGAYEMDKHFLNAPFSQNAPILLALIGIWNTNFFNYKTQAILPYEDALRLLPNYLQQLEMESNGKSVNNENQICSHTTAPILFGGIGCNGQHAYMQLLHQGNQVVPVDFLIPAKSSAIYDEHHKLLVASCLSQSKALMEGQTEEYLYKSCPGNRPSTTLMYTQLTPKVLGSLLALYEHKVFVQGVIWGINSFDQWGVELGKQLAKTILPTLDYHSTPPLLETLDLDSSTAGLIRFFQKKNQGIE